MLAPLSVRAVETKPVTQLLCDLPEIPGYAVEAPLGTGGMATVYRARQIALDRKVAIKVLRAFGRDTEELNQRFEQEAKLIAALDHPHIVAIYEVTRTTAGDACYVMPLLAHGDLAAQAKPMSEAEIKRVIGAVLDALGHAHQQGVIHRDVKAENVLFDARGTPLLADFGVALKVQKVDRLTVVGRTVGSSHTMSPEQARGEAVDGRSDLYSVGCMIYELLVGEHAFAGEDFLALALQHQQAPIPRLPAYSAHWQPLIDRALAKKPGDRYASAAAMAQALHAIERPSAAPARTWSASLPLLGALALAAALAIWWLWPAAAPAPDPLAPVPSVATDPPADALAAARAAISAGRVFDGAPDSGDVLLQPAFASEPVEMGALDLRDLLLAQFAPRLLAADEATLAVLLPRWQAFVLATSASQTPPVREVVAQLEAKFTPMLAQARNSRDQGLAAPVLALAQGLPEPSEPFASLLADVARLPTSGVPFRDGSGPEVLLIPAGRLKGFTSAFAVTRGEITRADYARFVQASGRAAASCRDGGKARTWKDPGFAQGESEPVVCVSHADAVAYAAWLTRQSGRQYRLPDLNEWRALESAARAGACANLNGENAACGDHFRATAPIVSFPTSAGLPGDLSGNVREWTSSCDMKEIGKVSRAFGNLGRWITRKEKNTATHVCVGRYVAGSGWRDRNLARTAVAEEADSAAVDLGFRLIRAVR